jgi:hypothetical protein
MEDLNQKLDVMAREKIFQLLGENSVRMGKINFRFTTQNQKHSQERMDALHQSFARLLRSIPKEVLNIEKKIRIKFQAPLEEERRIKLMGLMNNEIDMAIQKMTKEYRSHYATFSNVEKFDARMETDKSDALQNVNNQMNKLVKLLDEELGGAEEMSPRKIKELFAIDEQMQVQMNLIGPIQNFQSIFSELERQGVGSEIFQSVREGILLCVQIIRTVESQIPPTHAVNERKAWRMQVAKVGLHLKEMILCIETFAQQAILKPENRNVELRHKLWDRLETALKDRENGDKALANIQPLVELLET